MTISTKQLFDLNFSLAKEYLEQYCYPWEALPGLHAFIEALGPTLDPNEYNEIKTGIWVSNSAKIAENAHIDAPCIIGPKTEIRHCANIRGSVLIGRACVVGTATELKNVILFDEVQVPHYNYVGDSILGYKAHLGAGAITSNFKSDHSLISIRFHETENGTMTKSSLETGLQKLGAILGDHVEVGCNTVLNPGSVVGPHTVIYPLSSVRGVIPSHHILKNGGQSQLVKKEKR